MFNRVLFRSITPPPPSQPNSEYTLVPDAGPDVLPEAGPEAVLHVPGRETNQCRRMKQLEYITEILAFRKYFVLTIESKCILRKVNATIIN